MTTENNKATVRKMVEAHGAGDVAGFLAPMADDVDFRYMTAHAGLAATRTKQQVYESWTAGSGQTVDGVRMKLRSIVGDGDVVCMEAEAKTKRLNGSDYHNRLAFIFVFRDDKIVAVRAYTDTYHVNAVWSS